MKSEPFLLLAFISVHLWFHFSLPATAAPLTISGLLFPCQRGCDSISPTMKVATSDKGIVVAAHSLAAEAGRAILASGGNAVEAAVAVSLAQWFGASDAQLDSVFPTLASFNVRDLGFLS